MKKGIAKVIALLIVLIMIGFAMRLTNKSTLNNNINDRTESITNNLFYEYSDTNNAFSWNLYNGKKALFDSTKSGYLYYILNNENENNKYNQLLISMSDFSFWFSDNLKYSAIISNGKATEKKLDLGSDLRNNWNKNNSKYLTSDITNKYNIERKVTLNSSYTDQNNRIEYYTKEYFSSYMDIYVNSNNSIIYALPEDIRTISYVTKDEVNTNAVQESSTVLEGKKISNINNLVDSLGEPNYVIATNDVDAAKLTYVWYIFDNYYFYYTMQVNYYLDSMLPGADKIKAPLTGSNISDFEYGIVNKDYIYYTNNELARLFDAKENKYNTETWISVNE